MQLSRLVGSFLPQEAKLRPYGICGGQSGTCAFPSPIISVLPSRHFTDVQHLSVIRTGAIAHTRGQHYATQSHLIFQWIHEVRVLLSDKLKSFTMYNRGRGNWKVGLCVFSPSFKKLSKTVTQISAGVNAFMLSHVSLPKFHFKNYFTGLKMEKCGWMRDHYRAAGRGWVCWLPLTWSCAIGWFVFWDGSIKPTCVSSWILDQTKRLWHYICSIL